MNTEFKTDTNYAQSDQVLSLPQMVLYTLINRAFKLS